MNAGPLLQKDRLVIRWDVYRGFQADVSLLPSVHRRVVQRHGDVPVRLIPGTFRLVFAPSVRGLTRGWYSVTAGGYLHGPGCPGGGCVGIVRQSRFYMH
jgi:hypothetical protein